MPPRWPAAAACITTSYHSTCQNDATNDTLIRELGDALVSTGLAEVGYRTVNIDAGYLIHERHPDTQELQVRPRIDQKKTTSNPPLRVTPRSLMRDELWRQVNATKFPHGIRPLADVTSQAVRRCVCFL